MFWEKQKLPWELRGGNVKVNTDLWSPPVGLASCQAAWAIWNNENMMMVALMGDSGGGDDGGDGDGHGH